ncbi:UvrB/UvrC motif-containing protein [Salipaludibacillus aurantiacus]|uniref:Protein arginine kinase activator n=1 Tax=Salipaludibacillus aurantiacus TaxID=1601833 RepID=A0A1H9V7W6_9BACI|nr:UvrB/UvrC motif-containing protein [Salipaludibacillus aurantiacus]SES17353.1 protein arginine kinase activator [Salipaludibacillus aurantiacus]
MLCQECQERPASLHFTKIINGEKTEIHVCETCAKDKGDQFQGSNNFSIHQLLSGLLDAGQSLSASQSQPYKKTQPDLKCPSCGMEYKQFAKVGRLGCADCYRTFNQKLEPVFKRIHGGNSVHSGKIPKRKGKDLHVHREIENLKEKMKKLIEQEEFEKAAETRDRIRSLEESLNNKGGA